MRGLIGLSTAAVVLFNLPLAYGQVINGSFEDGVDTEATGSGFVDPGPDGIVGWTIIGEVDYVGTFWPAALGRRSIDLNGEAPATAEQTIATSPGAAYTVRFRVAANTSPFTKTLRVWTGTTATDVVVPLEPSFIWRCHEIGFIAPGAATRIAFESTTPGFNGVALDGVMVYGDSDLCLTDLTGDGLVDFSDYLEFLNLYDASDPAADFACDGQIDFADYLAFLNHYDAGC